MLTNFVGRMGEDRTSVYAPSNVLQTWQKMELHHVVGRHENHKRADLYFSIPEAILSLGPKLAALTCPSFRGLSHA